MVDRSCSPRLQIDDDGAKVLAAPVYCEVVNCKNLGAVLVEPCGHGGDSSSRSATNSAHAPRDTQLRRHVNDRKSSSSADEMPQGEREGELVHGAADAHTRTNVGDTIRMGSLRSRARARAKSQPSISSHAVGEHVTVSSSANTLGEQCSECRLKHT